MVVRAVVEVLELTEGEQVVEVVEVKTQALVELEGQLVLQEEGVEGARVAHPLVGMGLLVLVVR